MDMLGVPAVLLLARRLLETGPVAWIRVGSQRLPAYVALIALVVPFIIAEPAKIYSVVLMGQGHVVWGVATIAVAYLISLVVVDTIFEGARTQLRSIAWFARLLDWASPFRGAVTTYHDNTTLQVRCAFIASCRDA